LECGDECLKGDFYNNCGLAYKNLGNTAEALHYFELAKYHHKRSRHKIYLGTVENNLAQLYKQTGRFSRAHEAIDNASRLFRQIKDRTREGFSLDTKALVYFAESKFTEALQTAEKALSILKKSENSTYIVETLLTKAKVLIFLDNFSDAVMSLIDAVNIARIQTGQESVKRLIDEFESAVTEKNASAATKNLEVGDFELILPRSIAHFGEYRGVWINNTMLEGVGLTRGSLAIIVNADVNRGDLIALSELESDEVSCGFYDADFGIVCLEGTSGEPLIFDEKNTRVLGKIVGVCNAGKREDGKMVVSLLKL
jgi:tetratricopeptide (TPR) repeat protein